MKWLLFVIGGLIMIQSVNAGLIGYNQTPDYLHIWNNGTVEPNYYYTGNCLNDISNTPNEKWEDVKKYFGTEIQGEWAMVDWENQQNCTRTDISDNTTFVNNTANTVIQQQNFHINMTMNSHLKLNDDLISQIYTFYAHQGTDDKTWFLLSSQNITVGNDSQNDYIKVHNKYGGEQYYNLSYIKDNNMTFYFNDSNYYPYYFLWDNVKNKNIQHEWWNQSYNWVLKVNDSVNLFIELGEFERFETKQFTRKWIDAVCSCSGFNLQADVNIAIWNNETFIGQDPEINCSPVVSGIGSCTGCALTWYDYQYGSRRVIPDDEANSTDVLKCDPPVSATCNRVVTGYGALWWYEMNITCNAVRTNPSMLVSCKHQDHRVLTQNRESTLLPLKCFPLPTNPITIENLELKERRVYPILMLIVLFSLFAIKKNDKKEQNKD